MFKLIKSTLTRIFAPKSVHWRTLAVGEVIQEGDQFRSIEGHWSDTLCSVGQQVTIPDAFRRKFDLPTPYREQSPGYRFLDVGETLRKGDEFYAYGTWNVVCYVDALCGSPTHYRRKI